MTAIHALPPASTASMKVQPQTKAHSRSISFAKVHVLAAGGGEHRAQFGIRQRPQERKHARGHPHRNHCGGGRQASRDQVRQHKNARTDHNPDNNRGGVDYAETSRKILHGFHPHEVYRANATAFLTTSIHSTYTHIVMPNKTIYVKDTDLPLLEQAQEQLGDSVSSMFAEFLRERVAKLSRKKTGSST